MQIIYIQEMKTDCAYFGTDKTSFQLLSFYFKCYIFILFFDINSQFAKKKTISYVRKNMLKNEVFCKIYTKYEYIYYMGLRGIYAITYKLSSMYL